MAISMNDNIMSLSNKMLDYKWGPFNSVSHANSSIPLAFRTKGMPCIILDGAGNTPNLYWYYSGTSDSDLTLFSPTNIIKRAEFLIQPNDSTVTLPELVDKIVLMVERDGYSSSRILVTSGTPTEKDCLFDPSSGELTWAIPAAEETGERGSVLYT